MEQEWISLNEFMRRNKMGYATAKKMISDGTVECKKIGSQYKVKVSKDAKVNQEMEKIIRRNEELEITLKTALGMIQNVLK